MMEIDVAGERSMWAEVFSTAIRDFRSKVTAAKKGKRSIMMDGHQEIIGSVDQEMRHARMYFSSTDAELVADYAGIEINLPAIMAMIDTPVGNPFARDYQQGKGVKRFHDRRVLLAPKVIAMRDAGTPVRDIANNLNISPKLIYRIFDEAAA